MSAPHKIVRIIARLNIGGPAINATLLTSGLNHGQFATTLIAGTVGPGEGDMSYYAKQCGVRPRYLPELGPELGWGDDARALAKLVPLMMREQPAIVHTHTAKAGALGRAAAIVGRVPIIVHTFHGHVFRGYFTERTTQALLKIERALAARSSAIIALSERQRDELVDEFAIAPRAKVHVVPLGFDLTPFLRAERHCGRLRRELGVADDARLIGIIGRLVGIKNHDLFLRAAVLTRARLRNAHFVIVGDGPLRGELQAQAQQLGLSDCVHFIGWRQEMTPVYADLDVVALTSRNEGTPVALIEAQAAGVPVVATNVGGVGDTIADGVTGWLTAEEPLAVAERLVQVLEDSRFLASAGARGRALARERYSQERLLVDMERLYLQLLADAS